MGNPLAGRRRGFHQRGDVHSWVLGRPLWRQGSVQWEKVSIKEKHQVSSSKRNSDGAWATAAAEGTHQPRTRKGGG